MEVGLFGPWEGKPSFLTDNEEVELRILRDRYGIGALEAEHDLPEWERNMLIDWFLEQSETSQRPAPSGGPFAVVPEELSALG